MSCRLNNLQLSRSNLIPDYIVMICRFFPSSQPLNRLGFFLASLLVMLATCASPNRATAAVSANISIWHGYSFYYAQLALNASNPPPVTFHWMENASGKLWKQFGSTNGASDSLSTNNLNALIYECTNGVWKLYLNRGDASEQLYYFTVSFTGVTSNLLGNVQVSYPLEGSTGVENNPTYQWTGPSHFPTIAAHSRHEPYGTGNNYDITLPGSATSWTPGELTPGQNYLLLIYSTNGYPGISFTTPTNIVGNPLAGWQAQGDLYSYRYSFFNVAGTTGQGGHQLKAHYSFENGQIFAFDYSGNGNNIGIIANSGGGTRYTTNSPALGNFSAYFDNNGGAGAGWLKAPTNLLSTLKGSFTISLWVQTAQVFGNDSDSGLSNPGLVSGFNGPGGNWVVPMAITGNKLGFATGGSPQHTLNSATAITNDSEFVHLVVTRDQNSGQKRIYINGALDASGTGSTTLLDTPLELNIGYNNGKGLMGAMDEIQIYSGVLSATEVTFLYNNPGNTVPDIAGSPLGEAVDAPQFSWTTGGDADWFLQTDETNDGIDAAQSGAIDHNQESWIETTVEGPGYFSFSWNVSCDDSDGYDYLGFSVDGFPESEISGNWGWDSYGVYLDSGSHTLRWTYYKDDDFTDGQDAAWLDEVNFTPEIEVSMSLVIERNSDPDNVGFYAYPQIDYVSPTPITTCEVESPNGMFSGWTDGSESGASYPTLNTLQEVVDELQAGDWRLYINRNHPNETIYTFTVTVNQLDITNLPAVNFTAPTEWATGIATNHTFTWTGPNGYDSLYLYSYMLTGGVSSGFINLPPGTTSTMMSNALKPGTNGIYINYTLDNPDVEISDPQDSQFNYLSSWSYNISLNSVQTRRFVVGVTTPATPVQIGNPQVSGSEFSFSLLTQSGRAHTVQSRTNLTTAPWVNATNFIGDGNIWQITLPIGPEPETYFRVGTQ